MSENRLLLRVPEAAEALGIGRSLAYEMVARGELPVIRLGGGRAVRVPVEALRAWVARKQAEAAENAQGSGSR